MNKLDLLKLSELQDEEAFEEYEFEQLEENEISNFKEEYSLFYNDVKQPCKYIKEDW